MTSFENLFYGFLYVKPVIEDVGRRRYWHRGSLNRFVMRSWNEGLADFYGAVFQATLANFFRALCRA